MGLLDRRVLFVLGKGGVGKTTVAAALALAAVRAGKRTIVVEVASQHRLARLFDVVDPGFDETPLHPGLVGLSVDPQRALEEYLAMAIRVRAIAERVAESKGFGYVAAAAPGLRELVTLGKVWHLTEQQSRGGESRYDLVVVDAPATGHGIGLLRTPRQWVDIARVGRINAEARAIAELVEDRERTGMVLVTLAEEMPVTETADAVRRLRELGLEADRVVVNGLYPPLFTDDEAKLLAAAAPAGETGAAAISAALSHHARRRVQDEELRKLVAEVDVDRVELPFLFRPHIDADAALELAEILGPALADRGAA
jgi:anion-transporting  ArsA/GET3 family ATPase